MKTTLMLSFFVVILVTLAVGYPIKNGSNKIQYVMTNSLSDSDSVDNYMNNYKNDHKERLIVNATLHNRLNTVMQFLECNVSLGRIATEMDDVVNVGGHQLFEIYNTVSSPVFVSGNCYYYAELDVGIDDKNRNIVIDMIFFRNLRTGHEFYGLTSDHRYDVHIIIMSPGIVQYILLMK